MKRRLLAFVVPFICAIASAALAADTARQTVDPALVGTWRLAAPGPTGVNIFSWMIGADGHYRLAFQGPGNKPDETGQATFTNGNWTVRTDAGKSRHGTYEVHDPNTISIRGPGGLRIWFRAADSTAPPAAATQAAPGAFLSCVDPALVGIWGLQLSTPKGFGVIVWKINANGQYELNFQNRVRKTHDAGQVTCTQGRWSMQSDSGTTNRGIYTLINHDAMFTIAAGGGAATWLRLVDAPTFALSPPPGIMPAAAPRPVAPITAVPAPAASGTPPANNSSARAALKQNAATWDSGEAMDGPDDEWVKATEMVAKIQELRRAGKSGEALAMAHTLTSLTADIYGRYGFPYCESLAYLAGIYAENGQIDDARGFDQEIQMIFQQAATGHLDPRQSDLELIIKLEAAKKYKKALGLAADLVDWYRLRGIVGQPNYAKALEIEAKLCFETGNDVAGEMLLQNPLDSSLGGTNTLSFEYARSLALQGQIYERLGDFTAAKMCYQQELEIRELGPQASIFDTADPDIAVCLDNLARVMQKSAENMDVKNIADAKTYADTEAQALNLYDQSVKMGRLTLGNRLTTFVDILNDTATMFLDTYEYEKARPFILEAQNTCTNAHGEQTAAYAWCLMNLATLNADNGDFKDIQTLCQKAMDILQQKQGVVGANYLACLFRVAMIYYQKGDVSGALKICRDEVAQVQQRLDGRAALQPEYRQLAMHASVENREGLDLYLSLTLATNVPATEAYESVLAWKGEVTFRQRRMRALRRLSPQMMVSRNIHYSNRMPTRDSTVIIHDGDPPRWAHVYTPLELIDIDWPYNVAPTVENLCDIMADNARELSYLAVTTPDPKNAGTNVAVRNQNMAHEELRLGQMEVLLSKATEADTNSFQATTLPQLLGALPADGALVDVMEYTNFSPPPNRKGYMVRQRRLVAFVLRPGHDVKRIELGPAKDIGDNVDVWRSTLGSGATGREAGAELRKLVWEPLLPALDGVKLILLSPDGPLTQFPLGALPGKEPGHYLIEEYAIAIEASPQSIVDILSAPKPNETPSLLTVGGVDYTSAPSGTTAVPSTGNNDNPLRYKEWTELPGTEMEAEQVDQIFIDQWPRGQLESFSRKEATTWSIWAGAPGCRYIHLATHGFFSPPPADSPKLELLSPEMRQALGNSVEAGDVLREYPALGSGIVLAGANSANGADSILTGMEVENLNLDQTELVVLSACESGLGEQVAGEDQLGLQRAFQIAGARTVAASLWCVNDQATQKLMTLFYRNLWQKKLGKLQSLRQAQIDLLNEGAKEGLSNRGFRFAGAATQPDTTDNRLSPAYWAAFELSGDWR